MVGGALSWLAAEFVGKRALALRLPRALGSPARRLLPWASLARAGGGGGGLPGHADGPLHVPGRVPHPALRLAGLAAVFAVLALGGLVAAGEVRLPASPRLAPRAG